MSELISLGVWEIVSPLCASSAHIFAYGTADEKFAVDFVCIDHFFLSTPTSHYNDYG